MPGSRATTANRAPARQLERGHIYFAYRPRIDAEEVRGLEDVERFYVILSPRDREFYRLLVVGQKRLPEITGAEDRKGWAFVEKVSSDAEEVEDELDPKSRVTRTRGLRHIPAGRPAGEGVYAIARHNNHTHLAYLLELPPMPGPVQEALRILPRAAYVVVVRNPRTDSAVGLDPARRAKLPTSLQKRFRGRRFIPLDPPDFLDHEGAEVLLVGTRADALAELGIELEPQHEDLATAGIFTDLQLEQSVHPLEPLVKGEWA
ncbi:MAG TPA: hypothetical protein VK736_06570 [Candidatus Binatia bacterium]|nr:hypothetical protein [Candidatus Binatia bacterium]